MESGAETAGANIFSHLPFSYFRPKHIVLYFSSLIIPFQFKIFSAVMSHESGGAPGAALAPIPDCDCGSLCASDERLAEYINTRPDAEFDGVFPE